MDWQTILYNQPIPKIRMKKRKKILRKRFRDGVIHQTQNGCLIPITLMKESHLISCQRLFHDRAVFHGMRYEESQEHTCVLRKYPDAYVDYLADVESRFNACTYRLGYIESELKRRGIAFEHDDRIRGWDIQINPFDYESMYEGLSPEDFR